MTVSLNLEDSMAQHPKRWLPDALAVYDADGRDDGDEPEWDTFEGASDVDICRESDMGHPVASDIFESWPVERQRAAARKVDDEDSAR